MYLIGGRGQPVRTPDGVTHLITQYATSGFVSTTTCGIRWRQIAEYAEDGAAIDCMTCLVHEAKA